MRGRLDQRWVRLSAGASWMLLAASLLAPGEARAGCSHYVVARGADGASSAGALDALEVFAAPQTPAVPPPYRAPCAGPSCGRNATPPAAPAAVGALHAGGWAWLPQGRRAQLVFSTVIANQAQPGRPTHGAPTPERPPR